MRSISAMMMWIAIAAALNGCNEYTEPLVAGYALWSDSAGDAVIDPGGSQAVPESGRGAVGEVRVYEQAIVGYVYEPSQGTAIPPPPRWFVLDTRTGTVTYFATKQAWLDAKD